MKNLCIFTLYTETGASSKYRAYIFQEELEKNFNVQWFPFWNDTYITKYMHNKKKYFFLFFSFTLVPLQKDGTNYFSLHPNVM